MNYSASIIRDCGTNLKTSLSFKVDSWESIPPSISIDNFLSDEEIDKLVYYCQENGKFDQGGVGSDGGKSVVNTDIRDSEIKFFRFNSDTSWIFKKLKSIIEKINDESYNFDLVGFDKFQYAEYNHDGSKYNAHMDCFLGKKDVNLIRKLSLSLLLSDPEKDFDGGKLEISTSQFRDTKQKKGTIVLFPSFILHRVTPVTRGNRKSIVVWVLGPKFK